MAVINSIADANSVVELKGGYSEKKCKTALATVMGTTVGFVAFEGEPICPCCSYKAEAMVKLCDAYSIPVVTLVNANRARKIKALQHLLNLQVLMQLQLHLKFL